MIGLKVSNFDLIIFELLQKIDNPLSIRLYGYLNSIYQKFNETTNELELNDFDEFQRNLIFLIQKEPKKLYSFDLAEDLLVKCLNDILEDCNHFIIIESLKSIFIPKPIDVLKLLLRCCSNYQYVHCFVINSTYEEFKLRNRNFRNDQNAGLSVTIFENDSSLFSSVISEWGSSNSRDESSSSTITGTNRSRSTKVNERSQRRLNRKSEYYSFTKNVDQIYQLYLEW